MCCGTSVVGFEVSGPEMISISEFSNFVEYGNIYSLSETLKTFLETNLKTEEISEIAHEKYSKIKMVYEYVSLYKSN